MRLSRPGRFPQSVEDAWVGPEPSCGHWWDGAVGFVVEGVVVEGVDVVDGVVAELPPSAAYETPLPTTASAASAANTRMRFFTG
jgi:hypothetical protein